MAFEAAFLDLMAATVTVRNPASRDAYGKTTYATGVAVPAKVTYATRMVRSVTGEHVASSATVHLPPPGYVTGTITVPTVSVSGEIALPDGTTRAVIAIESPFDEDGAPHHQKVALQ